MTEPEDKQQVWPTWPSNPEILDKMCRAHHAIRTAQGFTTAPWDGLEERNRLQYRAAMRAAIESGLAQKEPRFKIGQQFIRYASRRVCTIVDIHRTYNQAGELVKLRYVTTHELAGRTVTDYDVVDTTIARSLVEQQGQL
jgi:hypothetical protein